MNRMMHVSIQTAVVLAMSAGLAQSSSAAMTTNALGLDTTTGEAWRSTSVAKTAAYDPNRDNVYGSDGYYVVKGDNLSTLATLVSKLPTYISSITPSYPNDTYAYSEYSALDDPSQTGAIAPNLSPCTSTWQTWSGNGTTYFTVKLAEDASFVLTVIVGIHNAEVCNVSAVTVTSGSASAMVSDISTVQGAKYAFFTLTGNANDTFAISLTGMTGSGDRAPSSSGIAFEAVPEPSTIMALVTGIAGLLACGWRKRK